MKVTFDDSQFFKEMNNVMQYSIGFLDGVEKGRTPFLENLGKSTIDTLKQYIDTMARVDERVLHHVYEWNQTGSPDARLFDINYTVNNGGLSMSSTFNQSKSIKDGSKVPFYDKARIMENGIPVVIKPKNAKVLSFESNGETVFTKNDIHVNDPGGFEAQGGFEDTFDKFFNVYFRQTFLYASGISQYLQNPYVYKANLQAGKRGGKSVGRKVGYQWMAKAGAIN